MGQCKVRTMNAAFTESVVEQAALAWLESLDYRIKHGPEIAHGEMAAERTNYGHVILKQRLQYPLLLQFISGDLRVRDTERLFGAIG